MKLQVEIVFILAILLAAVDHSNARTDDDVERKLEELESRLEDVEATLGDVEVRMRRQEDFTSDVHEALDAAFEDAIQRRTTTTTTLPPQPSSSPSSSSASSSSPPSTTTASVGSTTTAPIVESGLVVTVVDVRRELMSDGYRFTVRYLPHAADLRVTYVYDFVESEYQIYTYLAELDAAAGDDGLMSVTFEKGFVPYEDYDHTYVYFMTEAERVGIKVFVDPGDDGNLYTRLQAWPLTVSPESLVYQPGENTEQLTVDFTDSSDSLFLEIVRIDLTTGEALLADSLEYSSYFFTSLSTKYKTVRERTIQGYLKTARYRISGYVEVIAGQYWNSNSSAVETMEVKKRIPLRPSTQAGAFPDGYLAFGTVKYSKHTQDGTEIHTCNITSWEACKEIVILLSEGDVQMTCREITERGLGPPLPVTPPSDLEFSRDVKKFMFEIQPTSRRQLNSTVQCVAVNATGFQVLREVLVVYFVQPEILLDKSTVHNGSTVTVTCVARGLPLPRLSVYMAFYYGAERYFSTQHHDFPTDSTTVSPDGTEVSGSWTFQPDPSHTLDTVHCTAINGFTYDRDGTGDVFADVGYVSIPIV